MIIVDVLDAPGSPGDPQGDPTAEPIKVTHAIPGQQIIRTGTGFTGAVCGLAWSLLTNRVHPSRHKDSGILPLRRATGEQVIALFDRQV